MVNFKTQTQVHSKCEKICTCSVKYAIATFKDVKKLDSMVKMRFVYIMIIHYSLSLIP